MLCDMNIANMNFCYATTYAKTVNIYCPGNKTDKYYWGGKLSITFTGIMTHIRKEIPSITSITTNIRKEIPSITSMG